MAGMRAVLRRGVLVALISGLCLGVAPAFAIKTVALSSGSFAFEVEPGQTGEGEVVVINDGDEPIKVLVYVADVEIDERGEQTFPLPERQGANLLSTPSSWFRVFMPADSKSVGNTPYLELEVAERVPVKFDFSPPAGSPPGDHNIIMFFEMFDFADSAAGSAVQVSGRIGARVALRVKGEVIEKMTVRPFEVPAFRVGTEVPYRFVITNGGNLNKPVTASVTLLDRSELEVASAQVATETAVFAGSNLEFDGVLDTVSGRIGPHTVEVRVQYMEEAAELPTEIVEQRTVWLFPVWLLIALAVLVFGAAVWLAARVSRSGRQRPERESSDRPRRASRRRGGADTEERRRRREERAAGQGASGQGTNSQEATDGVAVDEGVPDA